MTDRNRSSDDSTGLHTDTGDSYPGVDDTETGLNSDESPPEADETSLATQVGKGIGSTAGWLVRAPTTAFWKTGEGVLLGLSRVIPRGAGLWQSWIKIGYRNLKRASGADRINHVMNQGHILHKPIYWNSNRNRWETKGGANWWKGDKQHTYIGPGGVPCAWGASEATELGNQVQAEVAEALELGATRDLYKLAQVKIQQMTIDAGGAGTAGGGDTARADGGNPVMRQNVSVSNPGVLEDEVANLATLFVDAEYEDVAEGRLVSMEKYYETYPQVVDSEEMQRQEDRGLLADMNDGEKWKIALYFMAAAMLFVLAWEYLPTLIGGGGGGGGGGIIPF